MKKLFVAILGLSLAISSTSCRKEKDTNAVVTVVDASENPVSGVAVRLYIQSASGPVREGIDVTETTNSSGVASFNFNDLYELGQAGFAVLDIDVKNGASTGIIKIEEETDNEQTIVCQTC
jgi:hypothetical protein